MVGSEVNSTTKFFLYLLATLFILAVYAILVTPAHSEGPLTPKGAYWDESLWSAVSLPDSAMVCRVRPDGSVGCIAVPAGTILLLPTPKAAD